MEVKELLYRMILVKKDFMEIRGPKPLEHNGYWHGLVSQIKDGSMKVKISCGTARQDLVIWVPVESDKWKLRFPK